MPSHLDLDSRLDYDRQALTVVDLTLALYAGFWDAHPDRMDYGEQTFLHAVAAWDTAVMCSSSRKMFNKMRAPTWGRVAAWAEYVSVRRPRLRSTALANRRNCLSQPTARLLTPRPRQRTFKSPSSSYRLLAATTRRRTYTGYGRESCLLRAMRPAPSRSPRSTAKWAA